MAVSVFLVDDHQVVRAGIRDIIGASPQLTVVGEASTVAEAQQSIPELAPDVAIVDVRLPDGSGIELCRQLISAGGNTKFLIFTSFGDEQAVVASVMAGAKGFLLKSVGSDEILDAIVRVAAGEALTTPDEARRAIDAAKDRCDSGIARMSALTPQERRILNYVAEGMTNRQIASQMFLAEKTVKNYVSNMLSKMGLHRRTEAVALAVREKTRLRDY